MVILLSWHNITSDSTDMSTSACSSVHGVYTKHGEKKQRQTTRTCTSYQHITNRTGQPMGWGLKQPLFVSVSKCFRCPHAISEVHIISEKLAHRNALFFPRCSSAEPSKSKNNTADTCPIERLFAKCCPVCKKNNKKKQTSTAATWWGEDHWYAAHPKGIFWSVKWETQLNKRKKRRNRSSFGEANFSALTSQKRRQRKTWCIFKTVCFSAWFGLFIHTSLQF